MHKLAPITPLGGTEPRRDTIGVLTITEVPDIALASIAARLNKDDAVGKVGKTFFGVALPGPGEMVTAGDFTVFWTAPGQWFAEAPYSTHELLSDGIASAMKGAASVTEQSDGWVRFDIEGATVIDAMERLTMSDTRRMAAGRATRGLIEHLGCFVLCRKAGAHFSVYGPRSSAGSLHHALSQAAKSIA